MSGLVHDLRAAGRHLLRRRLHAAAWCGTLALAVGAASAVFGLVDAVLLRPLPFPEADRLVRVHTTFPESGLTGLSLSPGEFVDLQERGDGLASAGAYIPDSYTLTGEGDAIRVSGAWATPGLFRTLDVSPLMGRTFTAEERRPGAPRLAVLSHGFWRRQLGGDPGVLGRTLLLDGRSVEVVGVMPPDFGYPEGVEVWTSLRFSEGMLSAAERGSRYLRVVGRMRTGLDPGSLERRLEALLPAFRREHPSYYRNTGFALTAIGLREHLFGAVRPPLLALLAGVALVLVVAMGNLANLSLVRTAERRREMAIRASLGASRPRLIRQVVMENVLLASAGGAAGAAAAAWTVPLLAGLAPEGLPRLEAVGASARVLAFGIGAALAAGLGAGLLPALLGSGRRLGEGLRSGLARGGGPSGGQRARRVLVTAQVAVTLTLLVGAGLVLRSLDRLGEVDLGLDPSSTLTARVGLPESAYGEPAEIRSFYRTLLARVRALPAVRTAGATAILPLDDGGWQVSLEVVGRPRPTGAPEAAVQYRPVTPGFFESLRVPLLDGRSLAPSDRSDAPPVAVVNRAFARRFLAGTDAVGARIELPLLGLSVGEHVRTVAGVVGDVRESLAEEAPPVVYVPHAQQPRRSMTLVVRSTGPPAGLVGPLRSLLGELDPALPLFEVRTMESVAGAGRARHRFVSFLLGLFSVTGLVLACLGVWGVVAYAVARRAREVGIRLTLGATPRSVTATVGGQGVAPVLAGTLLGLVGALLTTRFTESLLYGVGARDPAVFATAAASVLLVGALAAWVPARRAAAVDPAATLRAE